jgi:putative DNA-invertase from lambdoid prophage Rac
MPRIFAYARVSTIGQTTENQVREIEAAGFIIEPRRLVEETVSGSAPVAQRPGFLRLMDRLEGDDVLVVTKMDRLGRDASDVSGTVARLAKTGVRVHCLQLGGADLTSASGKLIMNIVNAHAEFERDLLIERTQAGLARARAQGKTLGRPRALDEQQTHEVHEALQRGEKISAIARELKTSRQTILRVRATMEAAAL